MTHEKISRASLWRLGMSLTGVLCVIIMILGAFFGFIAAYAGLGSATSPVDRSQQSTLAQIISTVFAVGIAMVIFAEENIPQKSRRIANVFGLRRRVIETIFFGAFASLFAVVSYVTGPDSPTVMTWTLHGATAALLPALLWLQCTLALDIFDTQQLSSRSPQLQQAFNRKPDRETLTALLEFSRIDLIDSATKGNNQEFEHAAALATLVTKEIMHDAKEKSNNIPSALSQLVSTLIEIARNQERTRCAIAAKCCADVWLFMAAAAPCSWITQNTARMLAEGLLVNSPTGVYSDEERFEYQTLASYHVWLRIMHHEWRDADRSRSPQRPAVLLISHLLIVAASRLADGQNPGISSLMQHEADTFTSMRDIGDTSVELGVWQTLFPAALRRWKISGSLYGLESLTQEVFGRYAEDESRFPLPVSDACDFLDSNPHKIYSFDQLRERERYRHEEDPLTIPRRVASRMRLSSNILFPDHERKSMLASPEVHKDERQDDLDELSRALNLTSSHLN